MIVPTKVSPCSPSYTISEDNVPLHLDYLGYLSFRYSALRALVSLIRLVFHSLQQTLIVAFPCKTVNHLLALLRESMQGERPCSSPFITSPSSYIFISLVLSFPPFPLDVSSPLLLVSSHSPSLPLCVFSPLPPLASVLLLLSSFPEVENIKLTLRGFGVQL